MIPPSMIIFFMNLNFIPIFSHFQSPILDGYESHLTLVEVMRYTIITEHWCYTKNLGHGYLWIIVV
jgi:hypothetical protein